MLADLAVVLSRYLIVVAAALVSMAAWLVGRRLLRLDAPGSAPLVLMLEYLGASAVFFAVDVVAGVGLIFVVRALTPVFVPLHAVDDMVLGPLAVCQGLLFWSWWRARRPCR